MPTCTTRTYRPGLLTARSDGRRLRSYEGLRDHALQQLGQATVLLKAKREPELGEYRAFVAGLAQRVARARTEGAEPVSEGERVAIELIEEAMS
jgi:hypothetical protein